MAHKHSVYDTDPHFSIDPATRVLTDMSQAKTLIIQNDHNSERFTFELPRYIDGHDMSLCDSVQIHYINIGSGQDRYNGLYEVTDLQISPDSDDVVICSWLVSRNATQYAGSLNFIIRFACTAGAELDYVWHTAIYSGISVSSGISNAEAIVEEYADILSLWAEGIYEPIDQVLGIINGDDRLAEGCSRVRHFFTVNEEDESNYIVTEKSSEGYWNAADGYRLLNAGEYTVWRYPIEDASKVTGALWHGHTAANTLLQVSLDGEKWATVIDNGEQQIGWQKYRELTDHLDFSNSEAEYLYVRVGVPEAASTGDGKYTVRGAWTWKDELSLSKNIEQIVKISIPNSGFTEIVCDTADNTMKYRMNNGYLTKVYDFATKKWANTAYLNFTFGEIDQEISKDFYEFLLANAVANGGVATAPGSDTSLYSCILNDMPITLDITYGEPNQHALPGMTKADDGKYLRVVDGQWRAVGGENVISRVQTYSFVVGEDSELKYLTTDTNQQGYVQSPEGKPTKRYADNNKKLVYHYHLANSAQIRGLVWSAICGQQLKLEISYDGETWIHVFEGGADTTTGLPIERRSFDLMPFMGTRGLLCYDELYIRISDVTPSNGFGGLVQQTVHLRTERFELPFGF